MRFGERVITDYDQLRALMGAPTMERLLASPTADAVHYLRYLVEPRQAEGKRVAFTVAFQDSGETYGLELRNGVIAISDAPKGEIELKVTKQEWAKLILGETRFDQADPRLRDAEVSIIR